MSDYVDTREGWREARDGEPIEHVEHVLHFTPGQPVVTLVREEPVPPLPTVPYTVIRVTWRGDDDPTVFTLYSDDRWHDDNHGAYRADHISGYTGFDVLAEPRAVTAHAVLDRVRDTGLIQFAVMANPRNNAEFDDIAREFGAES